MALTVEEFLAHHGVDGETLAHYGVLGMRWGRRKSSQPTFKELRAKDRKESAKDERAEEARKRAATTRKDNQIDKARAQLKPAAAKLKAERKNYRSNKYEIGKVAALRPVTKAKISYQDIAEKASEYRSDEQYQKFLLEIAGTGILALLKDRN